MSKINFKPGNMLYPLPAVMVSCGDIAQEANILTVAWTGTICTNPPMVYISVRPERYSYAMIRETGEFVINLTTKKLARATDFCGVRSGRDLDKWNECHLTKIPADTVRCPMIAESPVNIECQVTEINELGSHHMFLAKVTAVHVDDAYIDEKGTFHLNDTGLLAYSHGTYHELAKAMGNFGYSVRKTHRKKQKRKKR
ncbi:MAG TPA: flavin reductase family protein [Lachnospiraceae bacterium]|nr:flavin reductase family protein [Clostridium sp.]HCK45780.1 flavin reductase family protein [Lachnospiraceae bacterium]